MANYDDKERLCDIILKALHFNKESYPDEHFLKWLKESIYKETIENRANKLSTEVEYIIFNDTSLGVIGDDIATKEDLQNKINDFKPDFSKMPAKSKERIEEIKKELKTERDKINTIKKQNRQLVQNNPQQNAGDQSNTTPAMMPIISKIQQLVDEKEKLETPFKQGFGLSEEMQQALQVHLKDLDFLSKNDLRNRIMDAIDAKKRKGLHDYFPYDPNFISFHLPVMYRYFISTGKNKKPYTGKIKELLDLANKEYFEENTDDGIFNKIDFIAEMRQKFDALVASSSFPENYSILVTGNDAQANTDMMAGFSSKYNMCIGLQHSEYVAKVNSEQAFSFELYKENELGVVGFIGREGIEEVKGYSNNPPAPKTCIEIFYFLLEIEKAIGSSSKGRQDIDNIRKSNELLDVNIDEMDIEQLRLYIRTLLVTENLTELQYIGDKVVPICLLTKELSYHLGRFADYVSFVHEVYPDQSKKMLEDVNVLCGAMDSLNSDSNLIYPQEFKDAVAKYEEYLNFENFSLETLFKIPSEPAKKTYIQKCTILNPTNKEIAQYLTENPRYINAGLRNAPAIFLTMLTVYKGNVLRFYEEIIGHIDDDFFVIDRFFSTITSLKEGVFTSIHYEILSRDILSKIRILLPGFFAKNNDNFYKTAVLGFFEMLPYLDDTGTYLELFNSIEPDKRKNIINAKKTLMYCAKMQQLTLGVVEFEDPKKILVNTFNQTMRKNKTFSTLINDLKGDNDNAPSFKTIKSLNEAQLKTLIDAINSASHVSLVYSDELKKVFRRMRENTNLPFIEDYVCSLINDNLFYNHYYGDCFYAVEALERIGINKIETLPIAYAYLVSRGRKMDKTLLYMDDIDYQLNNLFGNIEFKLQKVIDNTIREFHNSLVVISPPQLFSCMAKYIKGEYNSFINLLGINSNNDISLNALVNLECHLANCCSTFFQMPDNAVLKILSNHLPEEPTLKDFNEFSPDFTVEYIKNNPQFIDDNSNVNIENSMVEEKIPLICLLYVNSILQRSQDLSEKMQEYSKDILRSYRNLFVNVLPFSAEELFEKKEGNERPQLTREFEDDDDYYDEDDEDDGFYDFN